MGDLNSYAGIGGFRTTDNSMIAIAKTKKQYIDAKNMMNESPCFSEVYIDKVN